MRTGLFVGSFDPFTNGHYEIVKKSLALFDKVVIGIGINSNKKRLFEKDTMKNAISELFKNEIAKGKIEVIVYDGLTAEIAKQYNINYIIRGLRNSNDYNYEEEIATANELLFEIDTIYLRAKYSYISSTLVRELISRNKDISNLVPKEIFCAIKD